MPISSDWTFVPQPTTAVVGWASTQPVGFNTTTSTLGFMTSAYPADAWSNGTVSVVNLSSISLGFTSSSVGGKRGWMTGRRPVTGQQFPRGIYNK